MSTLPTWLAVDAFYSVVNAPIHVGGCWTSKRAEGREEWKRARARGRVGSSGRPPRFDCASPRGTQSLSRPKGSSCCLRWHRLSYWDYRYYDTTELELGFA
eukprot:7704644-Pyramimonas_sp.AAC.1